MGETDLISRQAAIDVLEERLQANGCSNVALVSELNRSIGYLRQLPAIQRCVDCENFGKTQLLIPQPEQRWIPCSERLPDMHDEVLVTARGEVSIAWLYVDGKWRSNDMPQPMLRDIIAWMPLPEPYKGEQE